MKKMVLLISLLLAFSLSAPADAHFQMIYSPDSVPKSKKLTLKLVFTHPFEAGHTMDIGKDQNGHIHSPIAFGEMHKGKKKDLLDKIKPITFTSLTNSGKSYEAKVKLATTRWLFMRIRVGTHINHLQLNHMYRTYFFRSRKFIYNSRWN